MMRPEMQVAAVTQWQHIETDGSSRSTQMLLAPTSAIMAALSAYSPDCLVPAVAEGAADSAKALAR